MRFVSGMALLAVGFTFGAAPAPARDDLALWQVYQSSFASARYIDLTHAFAPGMPTGVGFSSLTVGPARSAVAIPGLMEKGEAFSYEKQGVGITAYELPTDQLGTQLDDILMHGHEPLDTDASPDFKTESWLLRHNYTQAEGVTHLDQVPEAGALILIGYAKPEGGTGGFARYIAVASPSWPHGVTIEQAPGAPLPEYSAPLTRDGVGVLRRSGR